MEAEIQTQTNEANMSEGEGTSSVAEASTSMMDDTPATEDDARYSRIKEKYGNDIDKVVKAYDEAQRKITEQGQLIPKAPEEYEFTLGETVAPDDPLLASMTDIFKDQNLTQDQANGVVEAFIKFQEENQPTLEGELEKLGGDKDKILADLDAFSKNNLKDDERALFDSLAYSAEATRMLHRLVGMTKEVSIPDSPGERMPTKSAQEYQDEAYAYRAKHAETIGYNKDQQDHYHALLQKAVQLESKK